MNNYYTVFLVFLNGSSHAFLIFIFGLLKNTILQQINVDYSVQGVKLTILSVFP